VALLRSGQTLVASLSCNRHCCHEHDFCHVHGLWVTLLCSGKTALGSAAVLSLQFPPMSLPLAPNWGSHPCFSVMYERCHEHDSRGDVASAASGASFVHYRRAQLSWFCMLVCYLDASGSGAQPV
jgi:hypothetical protein